MKYTFLFLALFMAGLFILTACEDEMETIPAEEKAAAEETYEVRGIFIDTRATEQTITIIHEEIPNVMPAMRMRMLLEEPEKAEELSRGDIISFTLVRVGNSWYVRDIEQLPDDTELDLEEDQIDIAF